MKRSIIIHSVIGLALLSLWVAFVFVPSSGKRKAVERQIRDTEQQLQDIQRSIESLPTFLSTREQLRANRQELDSRLFGKAEMLELFREIGIVAESNELKLVEISPPLLELLNLEKTVADTTAAPFLTLRLTLEGQYSDFGRFVDEMEQADFYRLPERCQISAAKDMNVPTRYQFDFKALLGQAGETL